jgi:hypothetical protein
MVSNRLPMVNASSTAPARSKGSRTVVPSADWMPRSSSKAASAIGARNQNTASQPHCATSSPPSDGPSTEPAANISA